MKVSEKHIEAALADKDIIIARLTTALVWYEKNVTLAYRSFRNDADDAEHALDHDAGSIARAALEELREVHAPAYQNIGLPGAFAIALMNLPLSRAEKAMDEGDVIEEFKPMTEELEPFPSPHRRRQMTDLAFPQTVDTNFIHIDQNGHVVVDKEITGGLTKREYFAAKAMQGLLANGDYGVISSDAIRYADQLIKGLSE